MAEDKDFELDDLDSFSFEDLNLEGEDEKTLPVSDNAPDDVYGVWVKGPVEESFEEVPKVADPVNEANENFGFKIDDLPEANFPDQDSLSLDEETLSLSADNDELEDLVPKSLEEEPLLESLGDESSTDNFHEISLDDFVNFDEEPDKAPETPSEPGSPPLEPDSGEDFLDIDIDIEDEIDDHELEILEGAQVKSKEEVPVEVIQGAEEIDLSEFGDFMDDDTLTEAPAAEVSPPPSEPSNPVAETETLDDSSFFEIPVVPVEDEEIPIAPAEDELPVTDLSSIDEALVSPPGDFEEVILADTQDEMDMNHIIALENDLTSGIRTQTPSTETLAVAEEDLASRVLLKIESELTSIKQELSDLKKELSFIKAPAVPSEDDKESLRRGFFDEEDDETIALTGDELDNIFSTAEINETEESGEKLEDWDDLIQLSPEGEPVAGGAPEATTADDFLSGTPLADHESDHFDLPPEENTLPLPGESQFMGIPQSIELEESEDLGDLPEVLSEDATENLLQPQDNQIEHVSDDAFESETSLLEIPFDEDILLEDEPTPTSEAVLPPSPEPQVDQPLFPEVDEIQDIAPLEPPLETQEVPEVSAEPEPVAPATPAPAPQAKEELSDSLKEELKSVLSYMDKLLASLPDDKIQEFAESQHFEVYKRLFEELGLIE
jgi:hypothetical protein